MAKRDVVNTNIYLVKSFAVMLFYDLCVYVPVYMDLLFYLKRCVCDWYLFDCELLLLSQLEACTHSFFDELREPNARLPNGRPLPPLFNFKQEVCMDVHILPMYI